ncbi:sugar ABC transporter ATP-binding protein [uncultured Cohaesibacter sp.]|uniref:sugar ABC transporter ATP-binding protein n=1 Tax=uncultured Cohaesibacter sp. TaxID=1002546 RepID=UPI0029C7EF08|nr:sugar ABC transporter ATP-binding protein [uncultured Cohaesibacter sp.]
MIETTPHLLTLDAVCKQFGNNDVIRGVDFDLQPGEIHALVGENGAGKSTCLGMMYGLHQPNSGTVRLNGEPIVINNPAHAQSLGIGCVFQEMSLAGALSVAENIYAGRVPTKMGMVDWKLLRHNTNDLLKQFDIEIDVSQPVDSLSISTRQIVEIAKALSMNSRILLLDEPTSALTPDEVASLFVILRKLVANGIGIIYVSHHMSEIFDISDRITVLRDGRKVGTHLTSETDESQVVTEMIGGQPLSSSHQREKGIGPAVLEAQGLSRLGMFNEISLTLHKGEIVGLAGLMGSRRGIIAKALVGLMSFSRGTLKVHGKPVRFRSLSDAMTEGLVYVPEERKTDGLFLDFSVRENLIASSLEKHTRSGFISKHSASNATRQATERFSIKAESQEIAVGSLSGGNQQKVLLAKWLERNPDILVIDEPTKGVDIGAKRQIHDELIKRASEGMSILVVSSDFPELTEIADRILVVRNGEITGEIAAGEATDEAILSLAAGISEATLSASQAGNAADGRPQS